MEYVEGGTLEKFCKADALLEPREIAEIIFKCVRALAFAQNLGLTHRDIKPGNILHNDGTEIKIADFGAAINKVSDRTVITNVGSPAYMSPELVQGTAQEVVASQSLTTWAVTGDDLPALATRLHDLSSVEQVAAFGAVLHVTGTDREQMQRELGPLMQEPGRKWTEVEPGLEDVFIHLMRSAGEEPVTEIH